MRATGTQRDSALYFDEMAASKVPVGFGRDGQPVFVNFEFVDGTRGAHVSISGVSGIATKTSFAMFLLHSITNCGVLAGEAHNTKVLVFSVKGEDLLFLDYANSRLTAAQRALYARLGLPAAPFGNVRCSPRHGGTTQRARLMCPPATGRSARSTGRWRSSAPMSCCRSFSLMPRTSGTQYTMLVAQVAVRLRRDTVPAGDEGAIRVRNVDPANDKIIRTFGDLITLLEAELGDDGTRGSWVAGSTVTGSINALRPVPARTADLRLRRRTDRARSHRLVPHRLPACHVAEDGNCCQWGHPPMGERDPAALTAHVSSMSDEELEATRRDLAAGLGFMPPVTACTGQPTAFLNAVNAEIAQRAMSEAW